MTRAAALILSVCAISSACGAPRPPAVSPAPVASSRSAADRLRDELSAIFAAPRFEHAFWSVLVRPLASSENLFALNEQKLMMPGSALKILTAAAAADILGWEHRFETKVVTNAPVQEGTLRGDLVVIGSGDPSISERGEHTGTLRALAQDIRKNGITKIEGGVIGDDDALDDRGLGFGWTLDNLPYGYSAGVSALEYNEGSVDLVIRAGAAAGTPVTIQVRPEGSGLQVENRLTTVAETGNGALTLRRLPGSQRLVVEGQIPANAAPFARTASVDNPTTFFASAFRLALEAEGIEVIGDAIDIDDLESKPELSSAQSLASHTSPPLREMLASMMRVSQNQYAELLLKASGDRAGVRRTLSGWGIRDSGFTIADGSGLSRYNYVTSETLVSVLQKMRNDPKHAQEFHAVLPAVGRDGTLAKRLSGTPADGKVRAKTGTVDYARAIAGYVETTDGQPLVFSIIANNFNTPTVEIDAAADAAIVKLATFAMR